MFRDMTNSLYRHQYHQSLVYKVFMADKQGPTVYLTFADVLEFVRGVHRVTRGVKQILYLVGWQFDGHDSKYPSWTGVNERLKRPEDASARDSLLWLMREAKRYNAVVSLHINMNDAYENSPLWDEYVKRDLLVRNADGTVRKGAMWGGEQSYFICLKKEWECGLARERIDELLEFLPLREAGTVHIDALAPHDCPGQGVKLEEDVVALRQILEYWREQGVDVTKEWYHHEYRGLVPMVYHFNLDEGSRLGNPPSVICGGGPAWNKRDFRFYYYDNIPWIAPFGSPEAGCLHEEAWGYSVDDDVRRLGDLERFTKTFFANTVPWLFLNRSMPVNLVHSAEHYEVHFANGVVSAVSGPEARHTIVHHHVTLKEGGNYCLPAVWLENTWLISSAEGGRRRWHLPVDCTAVSMTTQGGEPQVVQVTDGWLEHDWSAGQIAWITPVEESRPKSAERSKRSQERGAAVAK